MPLPTPFSAGPRLSGPPLGDPATQAVASLRGYAYQLYASGLAWLDRGRRLAHIGAGGPPWDVRVTVCGAGLTSSTGMETNG
jgi:hypothetical protein